MRDLPILETDPDAAGPTDDPPRPDAPPAQDDPTAQENLTYASDAARWAAIVARDAGADGWFFYSVATTGVYCYPSCGARLPRRENVAFHTTRAAAQAAGFRACRRCRSDQPTPAERRAGVVAFACRSIEEALADGEVPPPLATLASDAGLSPGHFQRLFVAVTGLSPRDWAAARRAERVRQALSAGDGASVTAAFHDAGYGSSGRFYEQAGGVLGMAPSAFRAAGQGQRIRHATAMTSLGVVLVAATDRGVCAVQFGEDADRLLAWLQQRFAAATLEPAEPQFRALVAQVVSLIEAPRDGAAAARHLPLDIAGTVFQRQVWQALRQIPAGETVSYGALAARIGRPGAHRAVARACAGNPAAVVVPCHRVVRGDGGLSGYAWGPERKRALLTREGAAAVAGGSEG